MPASAAYRFSTMSMYCRDHRNNVASGFACASLSNGDSSNKGSLSNRRACNVARLFFSRLTESLPSQISRPRIASISDTRSPCSNPTSIAMWCSLLWSRATLNSRTSSSRVRYSMLLIHYIMLQSTMARWQCVVLVTCYLLTPSMTMIYSHRHEATGAQRRGQPQAPREAGQAFGRTRRAGAEDTGEYDSRASARGVGEAGREVASALRPPRGEAYSW